MQGLEEALNAINRSYKFYQRHQDFLLGKVKVKNLLKVWEQSLLCLMRWNQSQF